MGLRQLRYFVTLAEQLHFGRTAAREHMVQSALSQQPQRLERELGVLLLDRRTHRVELTPAGSTFLIEARHVLAQVDRAAEAAQRAASSAPGLPGGVVHASYDSMQFRQLAGGRLDVGIGRASLAPPKATAELFRLDPLGVLVPKITAWPPRRRFR